MSSKPKSILETMLNHLGFDAAVEESALESGSLLNVQTEDDPGRLIGRQGRTLSDLQYLTNRLLIVQDKEAPMGASLSCTMSRRLVRYCRSLKVRPWRPMRRPGSSSVCTFNRLPLSSALSSTAASKPRWFSMVSRMDFGLLDIVIIRFFSGSCRAE